MYTFRICRSKGEGSIQMVWPFFYQIMDRLGPPHAAIFCNAKICSVLDLHLAAMAIWLSCTVPVWNESSAILWSRDLAKSAFGPYCRYICVGAKFWSRIWGKDKYRWSWNGFKSSRKPNFDLDFSDTPSICLSDMVVIKYSKLKCLLVNESFQHTNKTKNGNQRQFEGQWEKSITMMRWKSSIDHEENLMMISAWYYQDWSSYGNKMLSLCQKIYVC